MKLPKSKCPSCKCYQSVLSEVKDELTPAKLKFFGFIASHLQPYVTRYQKDMLMLPFLNADVKDLSVKLLVFIIKLEILKNYNTSLELTKIDLLDKDMFLKKKNVHLGFAAEQELRQLRLKDSVALDNINKCRKETMQFDLTVLEKFFARSPMKSAIVRNVSLFNPKQMVSEKPDQLKEKLKKLLHHLIYLNQVTTTLAENSLSQYMSFLQSDVK